MTVEEKLGAISVLTNTLNIQHVGSIDRGKIIDRILRLADSLEPLSENKPVMNIIGDMAAPNTASNLSLSLNGAIPTSK